MHQVATGTGASHPFVIPLTKIDVERRLVIGTAAEEIADKSREIMDYASARPQFESWSKEFSDATGGLSKGNLRVMHTKHVAGRLDDIAYDDETKKVQIVAKVVDDNDWQKCLEGVYTGFSIGGGYLKKWKDPVSGLTRYTPAIREISLVDNPCMPTAKFAELVKADGIVGQVELVGKVRTFAEAWATRPEPVPTFADHWATRPQTFAELRKFDESEHPRDRGKFTSKGQAKKSRKEAMGAAIGLGAGTGLGVMLGGPFGAIPGALVGNEVGGAAGRMLASPGDRRFGPGDKDTEALVASASLAGGAGAGFLVRRAIGAKRRPVQVKQALPAGALNGYQHLPRVIRDLADQTADDELPPKIRRMKQEHEATALALKQRAADAKAKALKGNLDALLARGVAGDSKGALVPVGPVRDVSPLHYRMQRAANPQRVLMQAKRAGHEVGHVAAVGAHNLATVGGVAARIFRALPLRTKVMLGAGLGAMGLTQVAATRDKQFDQGKAPGRALEAIGAVGDVTGTLSAVNGGMLTGGLIATLPAGIALARGRTRLASALLAGGAAVGGLDAGIGDATKRLANRKARAERRAANSHTGTP